jgi:hypothetical protein
MMDKVLGYNGHLKYVNIFLTLIKFCLETLAKTDS